MVVLSKANLKGRKSLEEHSKWHATKDRKTKINRMFRQSNLTQTKNKVFTFYRIFGFYFWEDLPETFPKVNVSIKLLSDWGFLGRKQKRLEFCLSLLCLGLWPLAGFVEMVHCKNTTWRSQIGLNTFFLHELLKMRFSFVSISSTRKRKEQSQFAAQRKKARGI